MDELLNRIETLERKLDRILAAVDTTAPQGDWVDSTEFCRLVGLADRKSLSYLMSQGVLKGKAVRNIGTAARPRYRFHRRQAVDQFLNRSATR
jgi:hypothetical protein